MLFRVTVFTRKRQLHQQAADPPVTVHLVNQLQQLLLGDRAWPHHCVAGNTCTAPRMTHARLRGGHFAHREGKLTQDASCSSFILHVGAAGRVFPD